MSNTAKNFNILATSLSKTYIFNNLYKSIKILDFSAKSFFLYRTHVFKTSCLAHSLKNRGKLKNSDRKYL